MRKLRLAAAVSLALATPGVFALGLGDIEMRSALNQPMNAEIRLTSVKPGELDGMIVKLASQDAFTRAGIERSQVLTGLTFAVDESGGRPVIRITSNTPVVEPFLNFLLEVDWPQGRMVREYTVLLDPPVFMTPSASGSSALGDSPALGNRNDGALIAPAPIERDAGGSNAAVTDSFEVELVGAGGETADSAASDGAGEIVSLEDLGSDAALLPPSRDFSSIQAGEDGGNVSLTDPGAPNIAADAARDAAAAADFDFQVETVGNAVEVADDTVVGNSGSDDVLADEGSEPILRGDESPILRGDEGEIVSLEELAAAPIGNESVAGGDVNVQQGDTLFEIADAASGNDTSVEQMMLALLAANRSAFINGNINLVRAGAILRVPDASEARALTQAQAVAEVGKQARLWQEYRDGLQSGSGTRVAIADTAGDAGDTAGEASGDGGLSADARAILEDARREIQDRESLRIVGEDSTSTASAVAGNAREGDETARLSNIERRLTLAREELSSTRLESQDLSDQAGELRNTTENFESLIALRQNDIAALEARLADARSQGEDVEVTTGEEALADTGDAVVEGSSNALDAAASAAGGVVDGAVEATGDGVNAGRNALTDAGKTLESVELVESDADSDMAIAPVDTDTDAEQSADAVAEASDPVAAVAPTDRPWYQTFLQDPARLAIAGVGGLALLGVLGTLLWRRRRGEDGTFLDGEDEVEFLDGDAVDTFDASRVAGRAESLAGQTGAAVSGTGAAVAGAGAVTAAGVSGASKDDDEPIDDTLAFGSDESAAAAVAAAQDQDEDGLDKDDTISEVDVYLAYGLHGQAEELLGRAVEREPNNPVYARKLLDTYYAQGNGEAFESASQDYHARFGGDANPEWSAIAALGHDLRPQSALFAGAASQVDQVGSDSVGGDRFGDDDFADLGNVAAGGGSVSRDFDGADSAPMDFGTDDESSLMDQSLDPAFAFDEGDLEATGDFSHIADEVAAERDEGIIEFPAFDADDAPRAPDIGAAPRAGTAAAMDAVDAPEFDTPNVAAANERIGDAGDSLAGARTAASNSLADDLTLDLDQLSGELELDGTELLDDDFGHDATNLASDFGTVEALEIPDLTADNELLSAGTSGMDDADEVDTMMDLAKAYIDMGDRDSASSTLDEIVKAGTPEQVTEAETLLRKIS